MYYFIVPLFLWELSTLFPRIAVIHSDILLAILKAVFFYIKKINEIKFIVKEIV